MKKKQYITPEATIVAFPETGGALMASEDGDIHFQEDCDDSDPYNPCDPTNWDGKGTIWSDEDTYPVGNNWGDFD